MSQHSVTGLPNTNGAQGQELEDRLTAQVRIRMARTPGFGLEAGGRFLVEAEQAQAKYEALEHFFQGHLVTTEDIVSLFRERSIVSQSQARRPPALVRAALKLSEQWQLNDSDTCLLLGLEETQEHVLTAMRAGTNRSVTRDQRERITALVEIKRLLLGRYDDDPEAERRWLQRPFEELGQESPLEVMKKSMAGVLRVRGFIRWQAGL